MSESNHPRKGRGSLKHRKKIENNSRQTKKRLHRQESGRWRAAQAEVERERRRLEALMAEEHQGPAPGAQFGPVAQLTAEPEPEPVVRVVFTPPEIPHLFEPYEGDGNSPNAIRDARSQIRAGYHVKIVMRRTGVGFKWLEDLVDLDGWAKEA